MADPVPSKLTIGIDIVALAAVETLVTRHALRFLERIYTPREQRYCAGRVAWLAALFAAKEAGSKALGTGLAYMAADGVAPQEIEVFGNQDGKPILHLAGSARTRAETLGLAAWSVSVSWSRTHAVALVAAAALPAGVYAGR